MDLTALREYVDVRFDAQEKAVSTALVAAEKAVNAALAAAKEAVSKAEIASDKRFDSVNEFRKTLSDNARLFMPRMESEQMHARTNEKLDELVKRVVAKEDQGAGLHQGWLIFVSIAGLLFSLISIAFLLFRKP